MEVCGVESATAVSGFFRGVFVRPLRDIGSSEITRGFGPPIGAISITSIKLTFVSHEVIGEMVVGRVNVAVSI